MDLAHLRKEEQLGLVVAIAAHVALFGVLILQPAKREPPIRPERMVVSLADEVGLTSTAPNPSQDSQAAIAPVLSETPGEVTEAQERPVERAVTPPVSRSTPTPRQTSAPTPRRTSAPTPTPRQTSAPPTRSATPTPEPRPTSAPARSGGGSRIGEDFLAGTSDGDRSGDDRVPASEIGPSTKASLFSQIAREIRPHWTPPSGADVEQLVTVLRFRLNPDGTLAGRPSVLGQRGVNDANRPQAGRHQELAIRAVQLAAPFDLDPKYYEAWKVVGPLDFDWKLSR